jgi:hypothetical protein
MANYVLLYSGGGEPASPAEQQAVIRAWTDWYTNLGSAVIDPGNPFSGHAKTIERGGNISDGAKGVMATGYTVVKADSLEAAVQMAQGCPHLKDGNVTVYETFQVA